MHCPKCHYEINSSMRFCTQCGAKLADSGFGNSQNRRGQSEGATTKVRRFQCSAKQLPALVDDLQDWLGGQHFNVQRLTSEDGHYVIQAAKHGEWRKAVGMSTATNVKLMQRNDTVIVEISAGRWLDKAAGGLLGAMVNPLFLVPTGLGALEQWQLPTKIFAHLAAKTEA